MNTYDLSLFCLTSEYKGVLITKLVEAGYQVASPYPNGLLSHSKGISNIITLRLSLKDNKDAPLEEWNATINQSLEDCKIYYYGYVLLPNNGSYSVRLGNIDGETDISRVIQMKSFW